MLLPCQGEICTLHKTREMCPPGTSPGTSLVCQYLHSPCNNNNTRPLTPKSMPPAWQWLTRENQGTKPAPLPRNDSVRMMSSRAVQNGGGVWWWWWWCACACVCMCSRAGMGVCARCRHMTPLPLPHLSLLLPAADPPWVCLHYDADRVHVCVCVHAWASRHSTLSSILSLMACVHACMHVPPPTLPQMRFVLLHTKLPIVCVLTDYGGDGGTAEAQRPPFQVRRMHDASFGVLGF